MAFGLCAGLQWATEAPEWSLRSGSLPVVESCDSRLARVFQFDQASVSTCESALKRSWSLTTALVMMWVVLLSFFSSYSSNSRLFFSFLFSDVVGVHALL